MSAPSKYPDWATDGNNVIEPPGGKVTTGWLTGERPPAQWFNAWQSLVGLWVRWLESRDNTTDSNLAALGADAARKSQANTFTQPQTIAPGAATGLTFDITNANAPLLYSGHSPQEHDGTGTNQWKIVGNLKRGGGRYAYMYVGADGPDVGGWAFVINAYWNADTKLWTREQSSQAATALVVRDTKIMSLRKDVGTGNSWATADWGRGGIECWDFTAGNALVTNDVTAGGEFVHTSRKPRTVQIPLSNAVPLVGPAGAIGFTGFGSQVTVAPGGSIALPIPPPHDSRLGVCRLKWTGPNPTQYKFAGYRLPINMTDTSIPSAVAFGGSNLASNNTVFTASVDFGGYAVNTAGSPYTESYWLYFENLSSTSGTVTLLGADYSFTDPGPRNY